MHDEREAALASHADDGDFPFTGRIETGLYFAITMSAIAVFGVAAYFELLRIGPLCCADNVYLSVAAQNLARGYGYVTSLPHNTFVMQGHADPSIIFMPFDPGISTGGPSQLLSTVLFWLAPDSLFAGDIAGILTRCAVLVGLAFLLPLKNVAGALLFAASLVAYLAVAHFTPAVFFTNIGDLTAGLLLVVGTYLVISGAVVGRTGAALAGVVVLYLALLTKTNSIMYMLLLIAPVAAYLVHVRSFGLLQKMAGAALGLVALTEFAVFLMLGPSRYMINKETQLNFIATISQAGDTWDGFGRLIEVSVLSPLIVGMFLAVVIGTTFVRPTAKRTLLALALVCALSSLFFNLQPASANIRYVVLPLVAIFGLCTIIVAEFLADQSKTQSRAVVAIGGTITAVACLGVAISGSTPLWLLQPAILKYAPATQAIEDARDYARAIPELDELRRVSWAWQNAADAEYLTARPGFVRYYNAAAPGNYYLFIDKRWTPEPAVPAFVSDHCEAVYDRGPRQVFQCHNP